MNRIIVLCTIVILPLISVGQSQFKLNSISWKPLSITVNGDSILIDSTFTSIETNYPSFDTVTIHNDPTPVICNFHPDSMYSLLFACCGSIDIAPSWKVDFVTKNNIEYNDNRYQRLLMDHPSFILKVVNNKKNDSIYSWYSDHACFPRFKLLTYEQWDYGSAEKCYYWNNISDFVFFKSNVDYSTYLNKSGVIEDLFPYPNNDDESVIIDKIGSIRIRLFDNEQYTIIYDAQSSDVTLRID